MFAKKDIYKARIVMLGQHMQEGIHFNDTHSPVPSVTCVRLILAITASTRRKLTQMDVKTAFLNAPIDIELDVILPDGFGTGDSTEEFNSFDRRRRAYSDTWLSTRLASLAPKDCARFKSTWVLSCMTNHVCSKIPTRTLSCSFCG